MAARPSKFDVHEKIKTGFLRVNIEADWARAGARQSGRSGRPLGPGVRWLRLELIGRRPRGGAVIPVNGGATYTDVLPSLNLVFDLQQDLLLRFGLGKTMARPRMDDMRAGADQPRLEANTGSTTEGHWVAGGGGKPDLAPWRAKSVDLSLEKYFQKRSYVAVAGFLKKAGQLHLPKAQPTRDFTGFPNYDPTLTPGCAPIEPNCNPNLGDDHHAGQWQRRQGLRLRGVGLLDGGLFTPALDGIRPGHECIENAQQPAE